MTYDGSNETAPYDLVVGLESTHISSKSSDMRSSRPFATPGFDSRDEAQRPSQERLRQISPTSPHVLSQHGVMPGHPVSAYTTSSSHMVMPAPRQLPPFVPNAHQRASMKTGKNLNGPSNGAASRRNKKSKGKEDRSSNGERDDSSSGISTAGLFKENKPQIESKVESPEDANTSNDDENERDETQTKRSPAPSLNEEEKQNIERHRSGNGGQFASLNREGDVASVETADESTSINSLKKKAAGEPCAFFLRTGSCAYGNRCKFHHPMELAPHVEYNRLGLPLRPGEPDCHYYLKTFQCAFGHTCKYNHPQPPPERIIPPSQMHNGQFPVSSQSIVSAASNAIPTYPTQVTHFMPGPQMIYPYAFDPMHMQSMAAAAAAAAVGAPNGGFPNLPMNPGRDVYVGNQMFPSSVQSPQFMDGYQYHHVAPKGNRKLGPK